MRHMLAARPRPGVTNVTPPSRDGGKRRGVVFLTLARVSSRAIGSIPKEVGELCHAEALSQAKASEQSLTCVRVCRRISLDGKRCLRLNQRSVGEYTTALPG
jgi:hypothetical protein